MSQCVEQVGIVLGLKVFHHAQSILADIRKFLGRGQMAHDGVEAAACWGAGAYFLPCILVKLVGCLYAAVDAIWSMQSMLVSIPSHTEP